MPQTIELINHRDDYEPLSRSLHSFFLMFFTGYLSFTFFFLEILTFWRLGVFSQELFFTLQRMKYVH